MKNSKLIIAATISLLMIFITADASFAGSHKKAKANTDNISPGITYQVNVVMATEASFCGQYIILIKDGQGKIVSSPQVLIPGVTSYKFIEEETLVRDTRTAVLMAVPNKSASVCSSPLHAAPDSQRDTFREGETYSFFLKASSQALHY